MENKGRVRLSVNINKLATVRNARGGNNPDLTKFVGIIEEAGADGITIHPRPDQRHIRQDDVFLLRELVKTEFNIEGYPGKEFIDLVLKVKPKQVTLVPDPPDVLTSNSGWDTLKNQDFLKSVIAGFREAGIRTSIFLNPDPFLIESAGQTGADRIELYTESFAKGFLKNPEKAISPYAETAGLAVEAGLEINAGHDLDLLNLKYFASTLPGLKEVSIGHALICDALEFGISNSVKMYLSCLDQAKRRSKI